MVESMLVWLGGSREFGRSPGLAHFKLSRLQLFEGKMFLLESCVQLSHRCGGNLVGT